MTTKRAVPLALVVAIAAILSITWVAAGPVRASLGNTGVPVRCTEAPGTSIPPGESRFLTCYAADGTPFADGQRVPTGRYLLVTDILVIPDGGTDMAALTDVTLYDAYGESGRAYSLRLRGTTTDSYGYHFTTPQHGAARRPPPGSGDRLVCPGVGVREGVRPASDQCELPAAGEPQSVGWWG